MIEIKHRATGSVLKTVDADTLRGAYLSGADLSGADLRGVDLRGADLSGSDLRGAYLSDAYLTGSDLRGAYLTGSDLRGAIFADTKMAWQSHDLIAEMLRRAARDDLDKRKMAGLILVSRDWCWDRWLRLSDPLSDWALDTLAGYVVGGDDAPRALRDRATRLKAEAAAPVVAEDQS